MTLDKFQIETMRGVLRQYWESAGHTPEAPMALCDLALKGLQAEAMREAIRLADKKLSKIMRLSVFDTCEKAAVIAHEARADLQQALNERKET
jgi:hypothetical protein